MLAHYVTYLGSKLGLQIPDRTVIDAAHKRWGKEGRFLWYTSVSLINVNNMNSPGAAPESEEFTRSSCEWAVVGNDDKSELLFSSDLEPLDFLGQFTSLPTTSHDFNLGHHVQNIASSVSSYSRHYFTAY